MKILLLALAAFFTGCNDPSNTQPLEPVPINGVAVYRASMGFRDSPNTAYVGGGLLLSDSVRALGGFCPVNSTGFVFDYRYSRNNDSTTVGDIDVRSCSGSNRWNGHTGGNTVDHVNNDFGPFAVYNVTNGASGQGYVDSSTYRQDQTEQALTLGQIAGAYISDGSQNGGAMYMRSHPVNVQIAADGTFTLSDCAPGAVGIVSIASPGKSLASVSISNCRDGKTASGFVTLDGDSMYLLLTLDRHAGFYLGGLTRQ